MVVIPYMVVILEFGVIDCSILVLLFFRRIWRLFCCKPVEWCNVYMCMNVKDISSWLYKFLFYLNRKIGIHIFPTFTQMYWIFLFSVIIILVICFYSCVIVSVILFNRRCSIFYIFGFKWCYSYNLLFNCDCICGSY